MMKKMLSLLILFPVVLVMASCSSLRLSSVLSKTNQDQQDQAGNPFDLSKQPVEDKLAVGILSLEGTDQAVTMQQARELLPLWKAVKSLGNSTTASDDEISALFSQIKDLLTAKQVQAIEKLSLTQEEMQALMEKYGGTLGGRPQGLDSANMTEEQKATLEALRQSNRSGNAGGRQEGGRVFGEGGGMPPEGMPGGGQIPLGGGIMPNAQGTPSAEQAMRRPRIGGLNLMLAEPVIKLLEERAGG